MKFRLKPLRPATGRWVMSARCSRLQMWRILGNPCDMTDVLTLLSWGLRNLK